MVALFFEVMDKVPSVAMIWINCTVLGLLGFFLCFYRAWFWPLIFILTLILLPGLLPDNDSGIRPAILREAGVNYYRNSYPAILIAIGLPAVGTLLNGRKKRDKTVAR
jgi:hypothetical protein